MEKTVTMCVCHRIRFTEILEYAEEHDLDFEDLARERICCCGCGRCKPYVEKMMRTGETAFVPGDIYINDDS